MTFKSTKVEDIISLTPLQEGMLFHYLKDPGSNHYFEQLSLHISGKLELHYFEQAWNKVIEANEMLRTVFRWEKLEKPVQVISKNYKIRLKYYDFSNFNINAAEEIDRVKRKDRIEKFDLHQVPFRVTLCKIADCSYELIISNHHILYDGWSNGIILKEFFYTYHALSRGEQALRLPAKPFFNEYIRWLQSRDKKKQENYWRDYLAYFEMTSELPIKKSLKRTASPDNYSITLEENIKNRLDIFVKTNRVTLASVFYTAWGILLQKYCHSEDVIFGTTISGRSAKIKGIEDMVGLFINTIPLRIQGASSGKIIDIITAVENVLHEREEFECTSLPDIMSYSTLGTGESLFNTIVAIENYPLDNRLLPENSLLSINSYAAAEMTHYDLTVSIMLFNNIEIKFSFKGEAFAKDTIESLSGHFKTIIQKIIEQPKTSISQFEIISTEEKNRILYEFNNTAAEYPQDKTIHQLFAEQTERIPDKIALVGEAILETLRAASLKYQHQHQHQITYHQLNKQSNRLAELLSTKGVLPDTIVAIMMERSIEMIIGIMGILKSGGAYLPIDPAFPGERIKHILQDSKAKIIIDCEFLMNVPQTPLHLSSFDIPRILHSNLAYVIYTSGSTGKPKGVMIEHGPVMNLLSALQVKYEFSPADNYLLKTSYIFDVSVTELFGWIFGGGRLAVLARHGEKDPQVIFDWIERFCVTHINFVPSMFNAFTNQLDSEHIKRISSLKYIFLAGEALLPEFVQRFQTFASCIKLENIYGPTESCVYASNYSLADWNGMDNISIGKPLPNIQLYILNEYNHLQPFGISGELYISGDGVSRGYLNNPELTAEKFRPLITIMTQMSLMKNKIGALRANSYHDVLYRTGDICQRLSDGNIEFLGRIDQQIKIRGFRIELGEIENRLLKHEQIKEAVVCTKEDAVGDNYLVAYFVSDIELLDTELIGNLRKDLPDYMIPSYFMRLEKIPLTSSGKVNRKALPEPKLESKETDEAPRSEMEKKLVEIWGRVLGKDIGLNLIGIDDNFFRLGGHSLKATSLVSLLYKTFNVKIPLREIFKRPTIRQLFDYINNAVKEQYALIEPVEKREYYMLSSAQKRLYFLQQMNTAGIVYNMPSVWVMEGIADKNCLESVFNKLIKRHEGLRTSFIIIDEEPVQRIHNEVEFAIEYKDCNLNTHYMDFIDGKNNTLHSFFRSFDLAKAPLLRVGLIKEKEGDKHILMVDMHHIISDGTSLDIIIRDFMALYRGENLPELRVQYKDFAGWQNHEKQKELLKPQENYWVNEFAGEITVLELPFDYQRPSIQSFAGSSIHFEIDKATTELLNMLTLETKATIYMILLAFYNIFLAKITNQEDIVVGSPIAGRKHVDLEKIIGMFVNTLPLRNNPSGEKTFTDFLLEVKEKTLSAFENQDFQYEDVVEKVAIIRDTGRNPLFDTVFVLQNMEIPGINIPGLKLSPYPYENKTAKFDLSLIAVEAEGKLLFNFEYSTKLFKEETIDRFITYFKNIVNGVIENKERKIVDFEIITEEEKRRILVDFNDTEAVYSKDKTVHQLFAEQALKTPDHIALVGAEGGEEKKRRREEEKRDGMHLSYRELNDQSDRLAGMLMEKGILAGDIVAIRLERSVEMIIAILGILKAGSIYMPIDIEYPEERINYMLKDSAASILLTNNEKKKMNNCQLSIVNCQLLTSASRASFHYSSHLAYIIYTSGSTGKPKGVIVSHRNVVRLVKNTNFVTLNRETRILQTGAPVFDATTFEIWGSLLNGGQLVLTDKETIMDAYHLAGTLSRNRINTLWLSAPLFNQLSEENPELFSPLKYLLVGGDVLSPAHINRVKQRFPGLSIINGYGPTENTTFSTTYLIEKEFEQNIPIGRPIANSTAYIYDKNKRLTPIGIAGELFVGGDGLALGYLNNPELTADRFNRFHRSYKTYILYKTGDLARWLADGNIEFLGRRDQQVKIRGFRVELEEIENYLLKFGKIKEAVVIPVEDESKDKILAAYIVWDKNISSTVNELKEYLQAVLPGYMIPAYIVELEKLPLTLNGKIDRKLLPAPGRTLGNRYLAPRDETEKKLVAIWTEILGIRRETIGIEDNFFHLGGHSLKATLMASRIQKEFKVKLPLAEIFKQPTVKGLAEFIKKTKTGIFIPIKKAPHRDYYDLSAAQRRMYLLYRMDKACIAYNIPLILSLAGALEVSLFEAVITKLIQRHESFRTSFELINELAVQYIHDHVVFEIEVLGDRQKNSFIRPFDLSRAPLLRVGLLTQEEHKHLLIVDMPHIISDGMSMGIFVKEFMALYAGEELPALKLQYKDYAEWQQGAEVKEALKSQEKYWLEQFENEIPVLNLPTDYVRPKVQGFEGQSIQFEIGPSETIQLKQLALEQNTTLYMILLAAFGIFLAKIGGQEDIVIGTPTAGRRHVELESIIGMFVNTLALRHFPHGEKSFDQFLEDVTGRTLKAFENQDYPFEDLVEKVVQERDMSRNPLFDVMFVLQNMEISEIAIPGLKSSACPYENNTAKFDITLSGVESDNGLHFNFQYCIKLFEETTIRRFIGFFKKIITIVLENPAVKLSTIEIIPEEERKQILENFNNTDRMYPAFKNISQLFDEQVEKTPDRIAVIGSSVETLGATSLQIQISYHNLNDQSNHLAGLLIEKGVLPDNIVGIMLKRSVDMIIGIFGILKSGGAYLPIDLSYPAERINYMLKDSGAKILITNNEKKMDNCQLSMLNCQLSTGKSRASLYHASFINHHSNLAYIIYTSGSTGRPKGVMVEQGNLGNLVEGLNRDIYSRYDQTLNICLIAPFIFDASIKQIFAALLLGHKLSIVPEKVRLDGMLLLKYLIKYNIDISDGTPSYLRLLTESITKDLLPFNVKYFIIGGEALTREITEGFFAKFSGKTPRIINIYGPTECTVDTTFFEISPANIHLFKLNIPIGKLLPNCRVYIINKYQQLQPIGIPGELLVSGNGVGRGYLSNPEMTWEKFVFDPFVKGNRMNHSRMYRTGDLARWLPNGNIEFLGRIDFQVKIRGFRIELGEIENYLLKFGKIKEALVIPVEDEPGEKNLAAYIVWDKEISFTINDLREYLQTVLPGYMIPGYIIEMEKLPLSINGKIDRKLLPAPAKKSENRHTAPRDEIDKKLTDIWSEILSTKGEIIGIDDNFFQLGGHSLKAAIMTAKVHKALHVEIPLSRVFETPTIRALSTYIKETKEKKYDPVEILPEGEYYELSSAQKRLYILQQMGLGSTGYNMPIAMRLLGELDAGKLEKIFKELINRHESLRTSFKTVGDRPMQKINAEIDFKIEHYKADTSGRFDISHFVRVFDLSCAPLVRVGLVKISPNEHIVMIDMHHIIADGTSLAIFYKEMMALYQGNILPSLKITYKDYAAWQNNQKNKEMLDRQGKFWLEQFAEDIPVLNLPIDYSRPVMQSFEGNRVDFELSREETELLKRGAQSQGATLYMAILAACNTWLSKLSGEEDIVIGSPVAGRNREEFQEIIGMFVNTLPLRNYPAFEKTFAGFLKEIKERTLTALENQDYPFEDLVEKIVGTRDTSRNPIFDVMFVFQNMDVPNIDIPGLMLRPYDYEIKTSKFDLNLAGMEIEDRISFSLEYSTKLFKEETIRRFAGYFKNIIHSINLNPVIKLTEIEIIDPEEKKRILEISNGVTGAIDLNETIHGWFEKIVLGNEHKTALVFKDGRITYGELNRRANRLAFLLQSLEIGPGKVVGLMVERSFEMIIGMLAIMKAGGAYLPIDPKLPGPRKQFMIENANISLLLTNFDLEKNIDYLPGDIKPYDLRNANFYQGTGQNPPLVNKSSDPVYVLFTSGSTGKPKGVMLKHTNLVNLIKFQHKYTDIDCSKVLQFTTISFDVSFQEIFTALTGVGELYLITQETREHISQLFSFINKNKIKTLFFPMSFIKLIFSQDDYLEMFPGSITHIVTAGEQVIVSDRFRNYLKQHQIYFHNHYGPSETHVVTTLTMNPNEDIPEFPSIGKPIMNTWIYILDKAKHIQPVGIAGELVAGGLQVGSGYLNNPEITADKFRPLIKNKNSALQTNFHHSSFDLPRIHHSNLYCTGDLARWLPDGKIEFLGRIDHQVKIRGIRVEPGEIENRLKKIPSIKDAVVIVSQQTAGDKYLCAYLVLDKMDNDRELDISQLRDILSVDLPDYMIPASFIPVDKIPLTPSGKVDRKSLPEPGPKESKNYMAPRDEIEKKLVDIWSEILGMTKESIGIGDNFFHLGGHSLKAINMINKIHKHFGVMVALQDVFRNPDIASLSKIITNSKIKIFKNIEKQEKKEYYELSYAQKRLWFIGKTDPGSLLFNMPGKITLYEAFDEKAIRMVLEQLTARHESLRTAFKEINKEPVQVIEPVGQVEINFQVIDISEITGPEQEKQRKELFAVESRYIFNLSQPPLLRIMTITCGVAEYDVVFNMHHIISDGWSLEILKQEFQEIYDAYKNDRTPSIESKELQYTDYAAWQNRLLADEKQMGKAQEFWREQLSRNLPVLNLPYDFSCLSPNSPLSLNSPNSPHSPHSNSKESAGYRWVIPGELANRLRSMAEERQASLFMILLAGFNLLLAKISCQEDIIIAIPAAARQHEDLKNIIGLFVNTLILCNHVATNEPFPVFFEGLQENTFHVLEYQDIPLESICGQLKIKYPEVSVFFNMVNTGATQQQNLENLAAHHLETVQDAKFEIVCYLTEYRNGIEINCHYYKNRFKPLTIEKIMEEYQEILINMAGNSAGKISEYFTGGKKRTLKRGGNLK